MGHKWACNFSDKLLSRTASAWCLLTAPVHAFPELLDSSLQQLPAGAGCVSLLLAAICAYPLAWLRFLVPAFSVLVLNGWITAGPESEALSHFTNAAFGILVMVLIPFGPFRKERVWWLGVGFVGLALVGLFGGILAGGLGRAGQSPSAIGNLGDPLRLPGLAETGVNPNVLGALALMTIPIAVGVFRASALDWSGRLAGIGAALAVVLASVLVAAVGSLGVLAAAWILITIVFWRSRIRGQVYLRLVALTLLLVAPAVILFASSAFARRLVPIPDSEVRSLSSKTVGADFAGERTLAPDGLSEVPKLLETNSYGRHGLLSPERYPAGVYRLSVFAKPSERSTLWLFGGGARGVLCDTSSGTSHDFGRGAGHIRVLSNGWFHCSVTFRTSESEVGTRLFLSHGADHESPYQGDGVSGMFVVSPLLERAEGGLSKTLFLGQLVQASASSSLSQRFAIWRRGAETIAADPWRGIGLNHFRHITQVPGTTAGQDPAHVHNAFLQVGLDLGLIGLAVYLGITIWLGTLAVRLVRSVDRVPRIIGTAAALSLLSVQLFGVMDALPLGVKVGIFQWYASGLLILASRQATGCTETVGGLHV